MKNTLLAIKKELNFSQSEETIPLSIVNSNIFEDLYKIGEYKFKRLNNFDKDSLQGYVDIIEEFCEYKFAIDMGPKRPGKIAYGKLVKREFMIVYVHE